MIDFLRIGSQWMLRITRAGSRGNDNRLLQGHRVRQLGHADSQRRAVRD